MDFNDKEALEMLSLMGGKENIGHLGHCLTRLRLVANDEDLVQIEALKNLPGIKGVFKNAGQIQIIIGPDVDQFYKRFIELTGINPQGEAAKAELKQKAKKNMGLMERAVSYLADIFIPLLPAIITGGMILGFRNIIGDLPLASGGQSLASSSVFWNGANAFLWLLGEAIFHFLPVGIAWSVANKMGTPPILGIVLGITLVSPQLMNAYNIGSMAPETWNFGFFALEKVGYQAQVVPALLAAVFMCLIERNLRKIIPGSLYLLVVPAVTLLVSVFAAHWIIGPAGRQLGDWTAAGVKFLLTGKLAVIGSAVFGFLYAPLVITGIHHTTNFVELQLVQSMGGTMIFPLLALSNIAQGSAAAGIALAVKKNRDISIPAVISAYLGVTEPAMYGVNLNYKFPMLCAMCGSAAAAVVCGMAGVLANGIGVGGLPGILAVKPQFWGVYLLAMGIAVIVPFVSTFILAKSRGLTQAAAEEAADLEAS